MDKFVIANLYMLFIKHFNFLIFININMEGKDFSRFIREDQEDSTIIFSPKHGEKPCYSIFWLHGLGQSAQMFVHLFDPQ